MNTVNHSDRLLRRKAARNDGTKKGEGARFAREWYSVHSRSECIIPQTSRHCESALADEAIRVTRTTEILNYIG